MILVNGESGIRGKIVRKKMVKINVGIMAMREKIRSRGSLPCSG